MLTISWLGLIGANPEDRWLSVMGLVVWSAALVIYGVYCILAFELTVRLRHRGGR